MTSRHVTEDEHRDRFSLYRLCACSLCAGEGKVHPEPGQNVRCPDCRGEGKIRDEIATAESAEAVGVALVLLAEEGEFEECPLGLLDRRPACPECGGEGCDKCKQTGTKQTGTWLILPWLPSARNVHDAAVTLAKSKKSDRATR